MSNVSSSSTIHHPSRKGKEVAKVYYAQPKDKNRHPKEPARKDNPRYKGKKGGPKVPHGGGPHSGGHSPNDALASSLKDALARTQAQDDVIAELSAELRELNSALAPLAPHLPASLAEPLTCCPTEALLVFPPPPPPLFDPLTPEQLQLGVHSNQPMHHDIPISARHIEVKPDLWDDIRALDINLTTYPTRKKIIAAILLDRKSVV